MSNDLQPGVSTPTKESALIFASSLEHLLAELERIDLLIQVQVQRARATHTGDPEFQGLCISESEVDALLAHPCGLPQWAADTSPTDDSRVAVARLRSAIDQRTCAARACGIRLRLDELTTLFGLSGLDRDIVLVCLAPEMDPRYEKLYAYLQDDVTKKRPSVDLVLNLFCSNISDKLAARNRLAAESPLGRHEILQLWVDPSQPEPTLLRKYGRLDPRMVSFLLGEDALDDRLRSSTTMKVPETRLEEVLLPETVKERLLTVARQSEAADRRAACYFRGPHGSGKRAAAEALCRETGAALLEVDVPQLLEGGNPGFQTGVQLVLREARLQPALIYWRAFDRLFTAEKAAELKFVLRQFATGPSLHFLGGDTAWEPAEGQLSGISFFCVEFPELGFAERLSLWNRLLAPDLGADLLDLTALSSRFRLNCGSIKAAMATARNLAGWRDPPDGRITLGDLQAACRLQSNRKLAALARKVEAKYALGDIMLPPEPLAQLQELLDQAKHRHTVYGQWGFGRKLSLGKGLNALFSGPPGTGKTMAAEVIAHELQLDLYKIDLSQIVSKYIGETEKNLDQIFREAQGSNAILFFDEAEALFGKRSETKDAHDRYANIEVGYLLQKMEEYEGIAILATNLRQNMDEAFVRRLHVIIEFPFPDEEHRLQLWQVAFPREAPVGDDVDLGMLAREVRLAGGNIKNIAVAAAFYAAGNGQVIRMPHLAQAARREHQKLGRTWDEASWTVEAMSRPK